MKITKSLPILLMSFVLLSACNSVQEGLSGSSKKGSDEFLVKKKSPLIIPPSFGELPEPNKKNSENADKSEDSDFNLKKVLNKNSDLNDTKSNNTTNDSVENSILKKINKK
jgi:hypothetical protein